MKLLLRGEFEELRFKKNYSELGWRFWDCFIFYNGKKKEYVNKLWDLLTEDEKEMCESI